MSDVGVRATFAPVVGSPLPVTRAKYVEGGWINCLDHTTRDGLTSGVATRGTLARTLNDGLLWEVTSVGPVVWSPFSFTGGGGGGGSLVFANIATIIAFDFTGLVSGTLLSVLTPDDTYELLTSPSAGMITATDGVNIIQPTTPNTVRVVRKGISALYIANWYIDPSGGNDANDGSIGSKLKTFAELKARLCPRGRDAAVAQATTVTISAGTTDPLIFKLGGSNNITFQFDFTSGSNITLSAVTNTAPGTTPGTGVRGQIATASGTFAVNQMLRCVSGSNVGAVAYVQELNGDAQHAFVTHWHVNTAGNRGTQVNLAIGDVVVVDSNNCDVLTVILDQVGTGFIRIKNIGTSLASNMGTNCRSNSLFGIVFDLCQGGFSCNAGTQTIYMRCQGGWFASGGYIQYQGGNHFTGNYLYSHTKIDFSGGDCVTGAGFQFYDCQVQWGLDWAARKSNYGMQFERIAAGTCIIVGIGTMIAPGSSLNIWGVTGAATGIGFDFQQNTRANFSSQVPTVNALHPIRVGNGKFYGYDQIPIVDEGYDVHITALNSSNASFYNPALTTVSAAANLYTGTPPKGLYTFKAYLGIPASGVGVAGMIAVFATYTDDSGVSMKRRVTAYQDITIAAPEEAMITIRTNGVANIQWSVESEPSHTFTRTNGSTINLGFSLTITCRREVTP